MLGFDGEYPAVHSRAKFWRFLVKNCKKSAVKHSVEKPILLNFVNVSPTFCPRLYSDEDITNIFTLYIKPSNNSISYSLDFLKVFKYGRKYYPGKDFFIFYKYLENHNTEVFTRENFFEEFKDRNEGKADFILHKKMKFSIKDFSSKCDQICRKLCISRRLIIKDIFSNPRDLRGKWNGATYVC